MPNVMEHTVLRRVTLCRLGLLSCPGLGHVTGGRVSPPGLASTARAGGATCFILLKNNNSIILWITMSLWLNSQTRLCSIWMNCFCIFEETIEDMLSKKSSGLQVSEQSRVSRVTPPTDWMTWAVTWSRDPALCPHWSDPPVYFLAIPGL